MHNILRARLWFGLALFLTLAACESVVIMLGPEGDQGIQGIVLLGPQCPVESLEDPCPDLPYQAWIDVRTAGGVLVGRVQSGEDGRFRVGLPSGAYILDPESGTPFPTASEMEVDVGDGVFTDVTVNFDTGIR
ncbi:MAG: hypothetical protein E4H28_04375 [Gemmatimonadales bacterium]|nr:MAG: hypothetical protein E4H28_04375 [Gemmatimonadales bacterium]